MAKIKYVARLNGVIVGTRSTDRVYTHAVVVNGHDKTDHVQTWCGRLDLAQGEQRKAQRYGFRAEIVPAEIQVPKVRKTAVDTLPTNAQAAAALNDALAGTAMGKGIRFVPGK